MAFSEIVFVAAEVVAKMLSRIKGVEVLGLSIDLSEQRSLDQRLARLDSAKQHLQESLSAIEELQITAKENKAQAEEALRKLARLQEEKSKAQAELTEVRKLAAVDISTFQKIAGVPSRSQIKRERVLGFVVGVLSSLVASALIYVGALVYKEIKEPNKAMETTPVDVTIPAAQEIAPSTSVSHL